MSYFDLLIHKEALPIKTLALAKRLAILSVDFT